MPAASTRSSRPGRGFVLSLALSACTGTFRPEARPIPGQVVSDEKLDRAWSEADVVFVGVAVAFSSEPPTIEPLGDYFKPVTFRVLEPMKGAVGSSVTVLHRARWPSPTVDQDLRLRDAAFGHGRVLVVFARAEGRDLRSRDREMDDRPGLDPDSLGMVAATALVLDHLRGLRR
jgi:hypothetical protein